MNDFAVYLNGIFRAVLDDIAGVQKELPEMTLYLQPYKSHRMKELAENPPSPDAPVLLLASTTEDLNTVQYAADIVYWRDKRKLTERQRSVVDALIRGHQPTEWDTGLYAEANGSEAVNLLSVRNVRRLDSPFSVTDLVNVGDGSNLGERTTAGSWVYVLPNSVPQGAV